MVYTVYLQTTGWTALFFAAKLGNLKIVQLLIAKGAQVNLKDKVTSYLIIMPLDVCWQTYCVLSFQNGVTAVDIAEINGHHQVSDELKKHTSQETKTEITEVSQYVVYTCTITL